jgi:hypothetical protein
MNVIEQLAAIGRRLLWLEAELSGQPSPNGGLLLYDALLQDPLATLAAILDRLAVWPMPAAGPLEETPATVAGPTGTLTAQGIPGVPIPSVLRPLEGVSASKRMGAGRRPLPGQITGAATPVARQPVAMPEEVPPESPSHPRNDHSPFAAVEEVTGSLPSQATAGPTWEERLAAGEPAVLTPPQGLAAQPPAQLPPAAGTTPFIPRGEFDSGETESRPLATRLVQDSTGLRSLLQANLRQTATSGPLPASRSAASPALAADPPLLNDALPLPDSIEPVHDPGSLTAGALTIPQANLLAQLSTPFPADLEMRLLDALAEELELAYLRLYGTSG